MKGFETGVVADWRDAGWQRLCLMVARLGH